MIERLGDAGPYVGIANESILLLILAQAGQLLWGMGRWIVNKYFREQHDKDAEVKALKAEFAGFREEVSAGLREIKAEMKGLGHLPSEAEIIDRLEARMEFLVFKAARDLGIKGPKQ